MSEMRTAISSPASERLTGNEATRRRPMLCPQKAMPAATSHPASYRPSPPHPLLTVLPLHSSRRLRSVNAVAMSGSQRIHTAQTARTPPRRPLVPKGSRSHCSISVGVCMLRGRSTRSRSGLLPTGATDILRCRFLCADFTERFGTDPANWPKPVDTSYVAEQPRRHLELIEGQKAN